MSYLVAAALIAVAAFVAGYSYRRSRTARDRETLSWFKETFLRRRGWTIGIGNYELQSFDGGKSWYAVEPNREDGAVRILGPAEEVHPGLLGHLDGMERLVKHVRANGPLTLSGPNAGTDEAPLKSAGLVAVRSDPH